VIGYEGNYWHEEVLTIFAAEVKSVSTRCRNWKPFDVAGGADELVL
jgi:hypothetical protein